MYRVDGFIFFYRLVVLLFSISAFVAIVVVVAGNGISIEDRKSKRVNDSAPLLTRRISNANRPYFGNGVI